MIAWTENAALGLILMVARNRREQLAKETIEPRVQIRWS